MATRFENLWYRALPFWAVPLFVGATVLKLTVPGHVLSESPYVWYCWGAMYGFIAYGLSAFWVCYRIDAGTLSGVRKCAAYLLVLVLYGFGPSIGYFWLRPRCARR